MSKTQIKKVIFFGEKEEFKALADKLSSIEIREMSGGVRAKFFQRLKETN